MNLTDLVPRADAIPGPWGLFEVLLLATFVVHLLLMNIVVGGAIVSFFESFRIKEAGGKALAASLPAAMALAVNFGVAPLLFIQVIYGQFFYVSSSLMAVYWLAMAGLATVAYYGLYLFSMRHQGLRFVRPLVIGLSAAMFLGVAFVFVNNMTLMLAPSRWTVYFDRPDGLLLNLGEPMLLPRYLHFMLAALAVGGVFFALVSARRVKRGDGGARAGVRRGLNWFIAATLAQLGAGGWFLVSLPGEVRPLFMGQSVPHTAALALGVAGSLVALYLAFKGRPGLTAWAAAGTVAVMAVARAMLRSAMLAPVFSPADLPVVPQQTPLLVFLAALGVTLLAILLMLHLASRALRTDVEPETSEPDEAPASEDASEAGGPEDAGASAEVAESAPVEEEAADGTATDPAKEA